MAQIQAVPPSTDNNDESGIRAWFTTMWREYGDALLRKDYSKLDTLAREIETKFRANCYEHGNWIVIGDSASFTDQYELSFCCFMATSMESMRRRIPSRHKEQPEHQNQVDWFEMIESVMEAFQAGRGDFTGVYRELGAVMKAEVLRAVESKDEEFVSEFYFRILNELEWEASIYPADWFQGDAGKDDRITSLDLHVIRVTAEEGEENLTSLIALGQMIRERLLGAVRSGDGELVLALISRITDEDYSGWRNAAIYDPAYEAWRTKHSPKEDHPSVA